MTFEEFDDFQEHLFADCCQMKKTKGLEYSNGKDRFSNFNEEAVDMEVPRLKVAEIFLNKHIRAIKSFIRTGETKSSEAIYGRIVDAIVYLSLIAGMAEEDLNAQSKLNFETMAENSNDLVRQMQSGNTNSKLGRP